MNDDIEQRINAHLHEKFEKNMDHINEFVDKEGMSVSTYEHDGNRMLAIEEIGTPAMDQRDVGILLDTYSRIKKGGIINNCYFISALATYTKITDGAISTTEGTSDFVGWGNHALNYIEDQTGKVMAIDFTAGRNTDGDRGNYHVLLLQAGSKDQLLTRLNKLYGGEWRYIPNDETFDIYKSHYFDNEDERQQARDRDMERFMKGRTNK